MKKKVLILLILLFFTNIPLAVLGQTKIVSIHQTQTFFLNSLSRTGLSIGDNRTVLPIPLPHNTVEWYYSFSATKSKAPQSLNLLSQLLKLTPEGKLTALAFDALTVPEGNVRCDVYLTDQINSNLFSLGRNFNYLPSGSRENYAQGVVRINDHVSGSQLLCIKNPASFDGINVRIEVIALVDTSKPVEAPSQVEVIAEGITQLIDVFQQSKLEKQEEAKKKEEASNYWNTGWILYESGDFSSSIDYSSKALKLIKHPALYFNIGLAQWCEGLKSECIQSYIKGLNLIYSLDSKETAISILQVGIQDIEKGKEKHSFYSELPPSLKLLQLKLKEVSAIERWKKRY